MSDSTRTFPVPLPEGFDVDELRSLVPADMWEKDEKAAAVLALRRSGTFDEEWYLNRYPDVRKSGMGAIEHYVLFGGEEKRKFIKINLQSGLKIFEDQKIEKDNTGLAYILRKNLGIEKIYVVNLARRCDRYIRFLREATKYSLSVKRINAIDYLSSYDAIKKWEIFHKKLESLHNPQFEIFDTNNISGYKSHLQVGVFAYILSQQKVLYDAIKAGYKRILVFDDDVFFHSRAVYRLKNIVKNIPKDFKILLLGSSEYTDRSSELFNKSKVTHQDSLYYPIPSKTCGSFSVVYDQSVYKEVLNLIDTEAGTYDNTILGNIYLNNKKKCYVVDPAICIPDVSDSDIRSDKRIQLEHSVRMNWETLRYSEYKKPLNVTILINSFKSLRYVENMHHRIGTKIFLNIFYLSPDGLRPVITGHRFRPLDSEPLQTICKDSTKFRNIINDIRIPYSDIVLLWPTGSLLTEDKALLIFSSALEYRNSDGRINGVIDNILYCLEAGISPILGKHSVIIPAYRSAPHVWPSVKSALLQSAKNIEVIVVNDNPDNENFSNELFFMAESWAKENDFRVLDERLILLNHKRNRKGAAARNTGLIYSSGEYISFLDDDDQFDIHRLYNIEKGFLYTPSDIGAIYCGYIGSWNGKRDPKRFLCGNLSDKVLALRYSEHYMHTNTVTYLRSSLQRLGGFNECYIRHQDLEINIRFFEEFKISSISEFLVYNRPSSVPETFLPNIEQLLDIKYQLLYDMRSIISRQGDIFAKNVIEVHTNDIVKYKPEMSTSEVNSIKFFLGTALEINNVKV